jgi:hypothetical protein
MRGNENTRKKRENGDMSGFLKWIEKGQTEARKKMKPEPNSK